MRRPVASLLAICAAAALTMAQGALWVRRDLLDSERFAAAAREALQSNEVRTLIADAITERALERVPVAVPDDVRASVAEEVATTATSDTFADAFEESVQALHGVLVSGQANQVLLDLSPAAPSIVEAVGRVDPALAQQVPLDELAAVDVGVAEDIPDLSSVREATDRALRVAVLTAAIALTLALLIAPERSRVIIVGGIALALTSGLLAVGAEVFVGRFADRIGDPAIRDAGAAILRAMTEGLRLRAWAAAALGVTAAAISLVMGSRRGRVRPALIVEEFVG